MRARLGAFASSLLLAMFVPISVRSQEPPAPVVERGVDGVFTAFEKRPIVALGDSHDEAQENAFYVSVIRDPRFANLVGNVVVEFGGAAHQDILDRYLAGETVPYADLRKVWTDTVGWLPAVNSVAQLEFFAAVRAVNLHLPPGRGIHVWLGEPPIDWSKVRSAKDFDALHLNRVAYPVDLIGREILSKRGKALVIYGGLHFRGDPDEDIAARVEADYPGSVFVVQPFSGYNEPACNASFEAKAAGWPAPAALVFPVKGTWLETGLREAGCTIAPGSPPSKPSESAGWNALEETLSGVRADALLYLGPSAALTMSPTDPTFYLDQAYFDEIARRFRILSHGQELSWDEVLYDSGHGPFTLDQAVGRGSPDDEMGARMTARRPAHPRLIEEAPKPGG